MGLTLLQTKTAVGLGNTVSFLGAGGAEPYTYTVLPGGQGGVISETTGIYSSPPWAQYNASPKQAIDTVQVTDAVGATAVAKVLVGPPLILVLDILATVLQLPNNRCFLYDQKAFQPTDPGLYVTVGIATVKTFANSYQFDPTFDTYRNFVNCCATLDVHVISRDNSALFQKENVLAALMSPYSIQQQNGNAFSIGRIPPGGSFNDLSEIDGPAIPYHFVISVPLFYSVSSSYATDVYTQFQPVAVVTNP